MIKTDNLANDTSVVVLEVAVYAYNGRQTSTHKGLGPAVLNDGMASMTWPALVTKEMILGNTGENAKDKEQILFHI